MIKRDFTAWDFVKQEPKKGNRISDFDILGGTNDGDVLMFTDGGVGWTTTTTAIGGNNLTVSEGINNTVFVQNLNVAGNMEIEPREGEMRTIMDEDGYWLSQFYTRSIDEPMWVTTSRTDSMITMDGNTYHITKVPIWVKFKTWLNKITTRPYRGHYEI
jgi:hypothetical protein